MKVKEGQAIRLTVQFNNHAVPGDVGKVYRATGKDPTFVTLAVNGYLFWAKAGEFELID